MPPVSLILSLVLLAGLSAALNTTIEVDFDNAPRNNNKFTITVPRVDAVVFRSAETLSYVSGFDECVERGVTTCTLDLINDPKLEYTLDLEGPFNSTTNTVSRTKVTVLVDSAFTVACSQYVFPVALNVTTGNTSFSCVPVFVTPPSGAADNITWYKSNSTDGMDAEPVDVSRVEYSTIDDVFGASVAFIMAATSDAGYYFPVTGDVDPANLSNVLPIIVAYEPVITSPAAEFSFDIYINPSIPVNHTFSCAIHSFPMADVTWRFTNPALVPFPTNETVNCMNNPRFLCEVTPMNNTDIYTYSITLINVSFDIAGIYTCVPQNPAFTIDFQAEQEGFINAHCFRIRVKDHLRQLWPAVGTVLVLILVAIAIALGALFDFVVGKTKAKEEPPIGDGQRTFSVTSNSSGDGQTQAGHMALRRLSSARVQLLEEPRY